MSDAQLTATRSSENFLNGLRTEALDAPASGIVEVFNYGRNRQGLIPLWVGEGDLPTPGFISDAAKASLDAGETFYTHQRGIPDLREAIGAYMRQSYGVPFPGGAFDADRFFVTTGGMHALQIAIRMTSGPGDEVIVPTPAWPNFVGSMIAAGATPVSVPMRLGERHGATNWVLDLDQLTDAITPRTRAMVINSPANPTGWTATADELRLILALARRHGLWIIADEIYGRFSYTGARAASFHDVMEDYDRVLFVQTMSKNWAMTGWRVGWLEAPQALGDTIENLIQFSTSGSPVFTQRAAAKALSEGEAFIRSQIERAEQSRDIICDGLGKTGRVHFARPAGAFYLFCSVDGHEDTRRLALRLVDEAGIGLAPGSAFGAGGENYLRICFARDPRHVAEVTERFIAWLARN